MKKIFFVFAVCCVAITATADVVRVNSFKQNNSAYQNGTAKVRDLTDKSSEIGEGTCPFAISLLPGVEIPAENWDVFFLRINIFVGRHNSVYGLDLGCVGNEVKNNFIGVQSAGIYNKIGYSDGALQFAGIVNRSIGDFYGVQAASILNLTDGMLTGLQIGVLNRATELSGLQLGLVNIARAGSGVQLGVWNSAKNFEGLQIGLGNYNEGSSLEFFPIMNLGF